METRMAPRPQATRTAASRSQPSSRPLSDSANDGDHSTNPCASHRACWTLLRSRGSPVFDPFLLAMCDGVAGASRRQPHPRSSPPGAATRVDLSLHHARSGGGCRHVCLEENNWGKSLIKPKMDRHEGWCNINVGWLTICLQQCCCLKKWIVCLLCQIYVVSLDCECCYFVCSTMEWNDQTNMKILIVIIFVVAD